MGRRRERREGLAVIFIIGFLWLLARPVDAKPLTPECWWSGTVLHAINLPPEWSMTRDPYPIGVTARPPTYEVEWGAAFTAYFWTRGGPYEALFKPGKQLNDYKPVCVAVP